MAPFLAACALYAMTPELTWIARRRVTNAVTAAGKLSSGPVPPHLSPGYIGDYAEYAIDVAQIVPMLLLPLLGVLVSAKLGLSTTLICIISVVFVLALIFLTVHLLRRDPTNYVSKKWPCGRYALLPRVGVIMNLIAAGLIGIFL